MLMNMEHNDDAKTISELGNRKREDLRTCTCRKAGLIPQKLLGERVRIIPKCGQVKHRCTRTDKEDARHFGGKEEGMIWMIASESYLCFRHDHPYIMSSLLFSPATYRPLEYNKRHPVTIHLCLNISHTSYHHGCPEISSESRLSSFPTR